MAGGWRQTSLDAGVCLLFVMKQDAMNVWCQTASAYGSQLLCNPNPNKYRQTPNALPVEAFVTFQLIFHLHISDALFARCLPCCFLAFIDNFAKHVCPAQHQRSAFGTALQPQQQTIRSGTGHFTGGQVQEVGHNCVSFNPVRSRGTLSNKATKQHNQTSVH